VVTNARGGQSNHNFGIAVDFGVFRGKVYLDSADPKLAAQVHAAVAVHARKLGFEWGGDWKMKDTPHFEIRTGLTMAEKRKRYKEKGSVL
jgi:peptidoglycan L-alanyl-D-glutamate endopeptidase CwlK